MRSQDETMEESVSPAVAEGAVISAEPVTPEQHASSDAARKNEPSTCVIVVHLTRNWVHAGIFGFAVLCIVIGAVEALFGR